MRHFVRIAFSISLVLPSLCEAVSLESLTTAGKYTFTEELTGSGKFPKAMDRDSESTEKTTDFSWDLGYSNTTSTSTDATTGTKIVDKTNDVNLGVGLETPGRFAADLGFDYSATPDENLADYGPNLAVGYTYEFSGHNLKKKKNQAADDDEKPFHPDIGIKLSGASLDYVQTFTTASVKGRRKAVTRPKTGANKIKQTSVGLTLSSTPLKWFSVKISGTRYSYDKDPNQYLSFLDSNRVISNRSSGLSSTVSGFPENELRLYFNFIFSDEWTSDFSETAARSVVDGTVAWTTKLQVYKDFGESWTVGLGLQNENSPLTKDTLALVDVKYVF